jgi:hypothetical protein
MWTVEAWPPTDENLPTGHIVAETFEVVFRQDDDIAVLCHEAMLPELDGIRFLSRDMAQAAADMLNARLAKK